MLYVVVGKNGHLFGGLLATEEEARSIASSIGGGYVALEEPWDSIAVNSRGGQGKSPFGELRTDLTTIRVPKILVGQVKKFAVWLAAIYE